MLEIQGKFNTAKVFTDSIEPEAYAQLLNMMCQCWAKDMQVRIMPDVHAGKGCTVGTTMTIKDKVVPNLVGVGISLLGKKVSDLRTLIALRCGFPVSVFCLRTPEGLEMYDCNQLRDYQTDLGTPHAV